MAAWSSKNQEPVDLFQKRKDFVGGNPWMSNTIYGPYEEIPKNFKKVYKDYLSGDVSSKDLCKEFKITQNDLVRWARTLTAKQR